MKKIDMIICNGQVFDSVQAKFEKKDIGIHQGRFVALDEDTEADSKVDAEGNFVVPGLIDEHAHLNLHGTIIGANADTMCIPNGITTACDGGTCGASNFEQFYMSNIVRYEPAVYSYLNVSTFGNKSLCKHEEDHDPEDFREDLIDRLFEKYPEVLRGLKVRMCKGTLGNHGMSPLYAGLEMSKRLQEKGFHCPVAIHYDDLPDNVSVHELFGAMRKGDVIAHVFQTKAETIFDENGKILDEVVYTASGEEVKIVEKTTLQDKPNSITQIVNAKGGVNRNYYDENGNQFLQISNNGHGHPVEEDLGEFGEHAHNYYFDENNKLKRTDARELTEEERKRNDDML